MSYILQALQRAQAERRPNERSGPDLGPTPWMTDAPGHGAIPRRRRRVLQIGVGFLGLTLALAAGWWFGRQAAPAPSSPPAASLAAAPQQASGPAALADAPPPRADGPGQALSAAPVQSTPAVATTAQAAEPTRTPSPALLPREPATRERAPAAPTVPAAPTAPVAREALPAAVRAGLPPLRIGGAIGADRPADRMLLVDGRVVREGETIAPGLTLQSIGSRQAIFAWHEQRFSVAY